MGKKDGGEGLCGSAGGVGRGGHSRGSATKLGVGVERGKGRSAISLLFSLACVQLWNIFKIIYTSIINSLNEMM